MSWWYPRFFGVAFASIEARRIEMAKGVNQSRHVIIAEKGYEGKFVALPSFNDRKVVASGKDPFRVAAEAEKLGYKSPLVLFVPKKNTVNIF